MKKNLFTTAFTFIIIVITVTVIYDITKYLIFGATPVDLISLRFWMTNVIVGLPLGLILAYFVKRFGVFNDK